MAVGQKRIAVLIDADNSPAAKFDAVLSRVAGFGSVNVRRAYGNWTKDELKGWTRIQHEFAITPIQQFDLTQGKNASDIAMVIDAMDLLHGGDVDDFVIVTSDSDFTPLVTRLRQSGATVTAFGTSQAPTAFQSACTRFYDLASVAADDEEADDREDSATSVRRWDGARLKTDGRLVTMLRSAIDEAADDDGWAKLATVGQFVRNRSSIEPRNYGYAKFSGLVEAIDLFETKSVNKVVSVRRRTTAKKTAEKKSPAKKAAATKAVTKR